MMKTNRIYKAFYSGKTCVVEAPSSYAAQLEAAKILKARKTYQVAVVLLDTPVDTASL
jgi:hypothetical protein